MNTKANQSNLRSFYLMLIIVVRKSETVEKVFENSSFESEKTTEAVGKLPEESEYEYEYYYDEVNTSAMPNAEDDEVEPIFETEMRESQENSLLEKSESNNTTMTWSSVLLSSSDAQTNKFDAATKEPTVGIEFLESARSELPKPNISRYKTVIGSLDAKINRKFLPLKPPIDELLDPDVKREQKREESLWQTRKSSNLELYPAVQEATTGRFPILNTSLAMTDFFLSTNPEEVSFEKRQSESKSVEHVEHRQFYVDCKDGFPSFVFPPNCYEQRFCEAGIIFQPESNGILMRLLGRASKYLAVGLSQDTIMGDDNVVECVRENDAIYIYRSFNTIHDNFRLKDHSALSQLEGNYYNGWIYCKFLIAPVTTIRNGSSTLTFDLQTEKFFLFLAKGNERSGKRIGIGYHDGGVNVSPVRYMLNEDSGGAKLSILFKKLHGISVFVAIILIHPTSVFVVRYCKDSYIKWFMGNLSVWFTVHLAVNGVMVGLIVVSLILLLISSKGTLGRQGWNQHNASAVAWFLMLIFQIIMGIGIYFARHRDCRFLSRIHAILGHFMFFLSFIIIYRSRYLRHGLPCSSNSILFTWLALYFAIHLISSYIICYVDYVRGVESSRIYCIGGLQPTSVTELDPAPPGGFIKHILLVAIILIGVGATIALIVMMSTGYLDCVKETEETTKSSFPDDSA